MVNSKALIGIAGLMTLAVLIIAFKPGDADKQKSEVKTESESFAVVELFTSEGCSSCPPADKVLADIVKKAQGSDQRIFALAFHVDYWNRLGWKDEYSSAEYSQRQRSYARALRSSVYTPQMVVNGKSEFMGSSSARAANSIENGLEKPAAASVELTNFKMADNQLQVDFNISGTYSGSVLNVAVVERGIVTDVKRGENGGRKLRYENVVRSFRTLDLQKANGSATLQLPDDIDMNNASVIAYVQNPDSKEIIGAQGQDLKANLSMVK